MRIRLALILAVLAVLGLLAGPAQARRIQPVVLLTGQVIAAGQSVTTDTLPFGTLYEAPDGYFSVGLKVAGSGTATVTYLADLGQGYATPVGATALVTAATSTGSPDGNGIYGLAWSPILAQGLKLKVTNPSGAAVTVDLTVNHK